MSLIQCDVCGAFLDEDLNELGFRDGTGKLMQLCALHHAAARDVSPDGAEVNWLAMKRAVARLDLERPDAQRDPVAFGHWDPLARVVALYQDAAADPDVQARWQRMTAPFRK